MEKNKLSVRERILFESVKLFATQSYDAASIRDIGKVVKIKPASIYYHFESKIKILEEIFIKYREDFYAYFNLALEEIEKAKSLEKTLDIIFETLWSVHNEFMYYGMVIILKEQFQNKMAKELVHELYYTFAIDRVQYYFDMLAENNIINPCNSKAIATFIIFSVLVGTQIRIQSMMNEDFSINMNETYQELYNFIYDVATGRRNMPEPH